MSENRTLSEKVEETVGRIEEVADEHESSEDVIGWIQEDVSGGILREQVFTHNRKWETSEYVLVMEEGEVKVYTDGIVIGQVQGKRVMDVLSEETHEWLDLLSKSLKKTLNPIR